MISRAVWTLLRPDVEGAALIAELERVLKDYDPGFAYEDQLMEGSPQAILALWFSGAIFRQLAYLTARAAVTDVLGFDHFLRLIVSNNLKSSSAQKGGWGCIADNMVPKVLPTEPRSTLFAKLMRSAGMVERDLAPIKAELAPEAADQLLSCEPQRRLRHLDLTKSVVPPFEDLDLVVTSPPYPGMSDYATSQRLSYYWLNRLPDDDLRNEIGARRKRFAAASLDRYRAEMTAALSVSLRGVRLGGYVCLVLPDFGGSGTREGERRRAVEEVLASLVFGGFALEHRLERVLPERRRHHNAHWTTLEREVIYIYRKVGE
jgi:hypothetical protein